MRYRGVIVANIVLLFLWEILSLIVARPFLPTPYDSFYAFFELIRTGVVIPHFLISLGRVAGGIILAVIVSMPIGIAMGYSEKINTFLSPFITIMYPLPKIVFLPIFVVFLGLGNLPKILLLFFILLFQLVVSIRDIVKRIPKESYLSMYSLTQSFPNLLIHMIIPWALPDFLTAIRISIGTSVAVLFFVETFASFNGIGYLILDAMERREYPEMYGGIIAMAILGLLLYFIVFLLEKRFCRWKNEYVKEKR